MPALPDARVDKYLRALREELSALGVGEAKEVAEEIRSHLEEASTEPGGLAAALAEFGSAEDLAANILRERGFLAEQPAVPTAPMWRRVGAGVIDVLIASVLFIWILTWVIGTLTGPAKDMPGVVGQTIGYSLVWFAIALLWAITYWANRSPAAMRPSWGLFLMGVRRVGVRGDTRTIRASAVTARRPGWRYAAGGMLAIVLAAGTIAGAWQSAASQSRASGDVALQSVQDAVAWDTSSFSQATSALALAAIDEANGRKAPRPMMSGADAETNFADLVADARLLSATTWEFNNCQELAYHDGGPDVKRDAEAHVVFALWGRDAAGNVQGRQWTAYIDKRVTIDGVADEAVEASSWSTEYSIRGLISAAETLTARN